jgi:hypothetical protein
MSNPDPNVQSTEIEREEMGKTQDTNINKQDDDNTRKDEEPHHAEERNDAPMQYSPKRS